MSMLLSKSGSRNTKQHGECELLFGGRPISNTGVSFWTRDCSEREDATHSKNLPSRLKKKKSIRIHYYNAARRGAIVPLFFFFSWAIQQYKAQHASFLLFFSFLSRPFPSSASRVYKYIVTHHWARFSSGKKKKRERELRRSFFCVQLNEMMNATFSSLRYRLFLLPAVGYTTDTYL